MATRWGIIGAGKICHDFTAALGTLPRSEHKVVAVAARDLSRAKEFSEVHGISASYGSYQELANDSNVEVVYIGTLNNSHVEHTEMMLNSGKHVLCEKPLSLNLVQAKKITELAKSKGLFLMEAMWSRFFPAYKILKDELAKGMIGDVKQLISSNGIQMSHLDRLGKKKLGGGATVTCGVYSTQLACLIFNDEKPMSISAVGHLNDDGVDVSMSASLAYKDGRTASIVSRVDVSLPNEAWIIGTKGSIRLPTLWAPTQIILPEIGTVETDLPKSKIPVNYVNGYGLSYEAAEVRDCLLKGLKESPRMTHAHSLLIAEIQDEIRRQLGVFYDVDILEE